MAERIRRGSAVRSMAGVVGIVAILAGCGSSSPVTNEPKAQAPQQAQSVTSTASSQTSSGLQIHFAFTNREGWHYSGTVPFPHRRVLFSKDVSSSPPGFARIKMDMTGEVTQPMNFSDDNSGRPNGPLMTVEPGDLVYHFSTSVQTQNSEEIRGLCELTGNALAVTEERPYLFDRELDCPLSPTVENDSATTSNIAEKEVETAVALLSHETPWYTLNFAYADRVPNDQCNIYISASGTINRGPEYTRAQCTPVDVSVNR
jgi:hypothetical protein